ncbi:hypothetical protein EA25_10285 [Vibrio navarrensis]|nr:hypothetical protein EA25_10285 [Vibrio navarrensis]
MACREAFLIRSASGSPTSIQTLMEPSYSFFQMSGSSVLDSPLVKARSGWACKQNAIKRAAKRSSFSEGCSAVVMEIVSK